MKSIKFSLVCLFLFFLPRSLTFAQVKFGTSSNGLAHESALLELESSTQGLLLPRMTTEARLAIPQPAQGLLVFDTNLKAIYVYANPSWLSLGQGNGVNVEDQLTNYYNLLVSKASKGSVDTLRDALTDKVSVASLRTLEYLLATKIDSSDFRLYKEQLNERFNAKVDQYIYANAVTYLQSELANKATYDDITNINHALAGKVSGAMFSQLSNQVTDNYNAIQNKVSLSDYEALKTNVNTKASLQQLNTLANDISTTYNLVQDKADQSALEQKLNKNGPAIFSGTLSITQDAKIEGNLLLGTELSGGGIVPAAGSVTIQNSKALASSRIFITLNALPSNGNCTVAVTQKADGQFTVSSNSNCDTALSFDYLLINSIQAAQGNN